MPLINSFVKTERMTVENISWSNLNERMLPTWPGGGRTRNLLITSRTRIQLSNRGRLARSVNLLPLFPDMLSSLSEWLTSPWGYTFDKEWLTSPSAYTFDSNWQLTFLILRKGVNGRRNYFMIIQPKAMWPSSSRKHAYIILTPLNPTFM